MHVTQLKAIYYSISLNSKHIDFPPHLLSLTSLTHNSSFPFHFSCIKHTETMLRPVTAHPIEVLLKGGLEIRNLVQHKH